jgi:hypothetical protein
VTEFTHDALAAKRMIRIASRKWAPSQDSNSRYLSYRIARENYEIGIGATVTRRPLPHHRAYGSVHGGSRGLR